MFFDFCIYHALTLLMLFCMASKVDPFFALVFEQLNGRGQSYRSVCEVLLDQGVEISPQALRSWHLRRSRKIAERAGSQSRASPTIENTGSLDLRSTNPAKANRPTTTGPTVRQKLDSNRVEGLQDAIERQQQNLAANPFSLGNSNFPIHRKR